MPILRQAAQIGERQDAGQKPGSLGPRPGLSGLGPNIVLIGRLDGSLVQTVPGGKTLFAWA